MKFLWRKWLGLTASVLVAGAAAADPPGPEANASRVIARTGPVAAPEKRPIAVTLDRPRVVADEGVTPASFRVEPAGPVFRAQAPDLRYAPGGPVTSTVDPPPLPLHMPTPVPGSTSYAPVPGSTSYAPGPVVIVPGDQPPVVGGPPTGFAADNPFHPEVWEGEGFGPALCGQSVSCQFNNVLFVEGEALAWWFRQATLPPLAVIGVPGMPPRLGGMGPIDNVLVGDNIGQSDLHYGFRVRAGMWLNRDHTLGVEGSFLWLNQDTDNDQFMTSGQTLLGIPFINALNNQETSLPLGGNGVPGGLKVALETRLWGAEVNFRANAWAWENIHVDLLAGYRVLGLDDNLELNAVGGPMGMDPAFSLQDRISTRNRFHGGQIGANVEWRFGRFSLDVTGKVALGGTEQTVEAGGNFRRGAMWGTGGLFSQPSNIGSFASNRFSWVPELGLKFGYQVNDSLRAFAGYNFLYWSDVVRPGDQISRSVNPTQLFGGTLQGPARPLQIFKAGEFWAQGVSLGLEFRY